MVARTLTALVEPAVLRWARESIGLTPLAAARKIGLSDETLVEQWEAGSAAPSIPQLREAARVYKRPLAVFFLSLPPDGNFDVMHDFRRFPYTGMTGSPGKKETACGAVSLRRHCPDQVPGGRRSASELSPASQPFLPGSGSPRHSVRSSSLDHLADNMHVAWRR